MESKTYYLIGYKMPTDNFPVRDRATSDPELFATLYTIIEKGAVSISIEKLKG